MCGTCKQERPEGADRDEVLISGEPSIGTVQPIKAVVAPGDEAKVSVRLVPGRDIKGILTEPPKPTCQPRGDRPYGLGAVAFPVELVEKLVEANSRISAWLAKDPANARAYLDDPVAALGEAGVDLSRAEAKAVARAHAALKEEAVLPPGARIAALEAVAVKRGKVGDRTPAEDRDDRPSAAGRPSDRPVDPTQDRPGTPAKRGCGCG